jgi:F0F1-type ATP synthase membrane subunit b/b'
MKKWFDACETGLNVLGVAIGVSDVESILNVILLIVSIAAILFRAGYAIYQHVKEKNYSKIAEELESAKKQLEQLQAKEDNKDGEC